MNTSNAAASGLTVSVEDPRGLRLFAGAALSPVSPNRQISARRFTGTASAIISAFLLACIPVDPVSGLPPHSSGASVTFNGLIATSRLPSQQITLTRPVCHCALRDSAVSC